MTATGGLRTAAIVLALAGVLDPSWTIRHRVPAAVDVRISASTAHEAALARDVERVLVRALKGAVAFNSAATPRAIVSIGDRVDHRSIRDGLPVSTVSLTAPRSPNVRVVAVTEPRLVPAGWNTTVTATLEARGVSGSTSLVSLDLNGADVARIEHTWTRDPERFDAALAYAPPVAGTARARIRAEPLPNEVTSLDNTIDVRLDASARRLKVLAYEPRPSWAAGFVRRALERDPTFDVAQLVRASRGLEVRAGPVPASLTADALEPFDVVLVGAPEALRPADVDALGSFARRRGGSVIFLPDRRPSGRYLELVPAQRFEERLSEGGLDLPSSAGPTLRASELALPLAPLPGAETLVSLGDGRASRAVVMTWPLGAGRIIFSGALDAWRFRAHSTNGFDRFWRSEIAAAALAAPRTLEVSLTPAVVAPGGAVRIRARLRRTEFLSQPEHDTIAIPAISARLVGVNGEEHSVRLWPSAEPGAFEARMVAPVPGEYNVQVRVAGGASVDVTLTVADDAGSASAGDHGDHGDHEALALIASATGGVGASAADLAPLERYLRALPKEEGTYAQHPARSFWLLLTFVATLGAEWALRRRAGWP